jgi:hypothetical protein
MLSITNNPFMLSVIMLIVIMLSVMAPENKFYNNCPAVAFKPKVGCSVYPATPSNVIKMAKSCITSTAAARAIFTTLYFLLYL